MSSSQKNTRPTPPSVCHFCVSCMANTECSKVIASKSASLSRQPWTLLHRVYLPIQDPNPSATSSYNYATKHATSPTFLPIWSRAFPPTTPPEPPSPPTRPRCVSASTPTHVPT